MKHPKILLTSLVIQTATWSGCGTEVVGLCDGTTYVLRTVDGVDLPAIVEGQGVQWTIQADTIRFEAGNLWDATNHPIAPAGQPGRGAVGF